MFLSKVLFEYEKIFDPGLWIFISSFITVFQINHSSFTFFSGIYSFLFHNIDIFVELYVVIQNNHKVDRIYEWL